MGQAQGGILVRVPRARFARALCACAPRTCFAHVSAPRALRARAPRATSENACYDRLSISQVLEKASEIANWSAYT